MLTQCYRCGDDLSETNKSYEHVIPNSLGGRLGSDKLLCKKCNNFYGSELDSEISKQIGFKAHIINVKTDRALPSKLTGYNQDGKEVSFAPGLKPLDKVTLKVQDRKIDFFMTSGEVGGFVNRKKREMVKKGKDMTYIPYTQLPGDTVYFRNNIPAENGKIGFGGDLYLKAISRIAVNFYLMHSNNLHFVKYVIEELEKPNTKPRARFCYSDTSSFVDKKQGEISHTIVLKGNPDRRILYAYIDLFGCHRHLVNLNTNYSGPPINQVYSYDCIEGCEQSKNEWVYITRPMLTDYNLLDYVKRHQFSSTLHSEAHENFWRIVQNLQQKK